MLQQLSRLTRYSSAVAALMSLLLVSCSGDKEILLAPQVGLPTSTQHSVLEVNGNKLAGTGLMVNGEIVTPIDDKTTFAALLTLTPGINQLHLSFADADDRDSQVVTHEIALTTTGQPGQPGLISPTADERFLTLTPTFRWRSAGMDRGVELYQYELEITASGFSEKINAGSNLNYTPTTPLPYGSLLWRVCATPLPGPALPLSENTPSYCSVSQRFYTGRNPADLNGDSLGDVVIGAPMQDYSGWEAGSVYLAFGKETNATATSDIRLVGFSAHGNFGAALAQGLDVNHDGIGDLLVGEPGSSKGKILVYHGGDPQTGNFSYVAAAEIQPPTSVGIQGFGRSLSIIGDFNGDSYEDLAVGAPDSSSGGCVLLYCGASDGSLSSAPCMTFIRNQAPGEPPSADAFGASIARLGDFNGDGASDMAIGAPQFSQHGAVYIYFGGSIADTQADLVIYGNAGGNAEGSAGSTAVQRIGTSLHGGGDLNADAFADLAIGAADTTYLLFGGASLIETDLPLVTLTADDTDEEIVAAEFGASLLMLPANTPTAYADLLIGAPASNAGSGLIYTMAGRRHFPATATLSPSSTNEFEESQTIGDFGRSLAWVPNFSASQDVVLVGAPTASGVSSLSPTGPGRVDLLQKSGLNPFASLVGENDADQFGAGLGCFR